MKHKMRNMVFIIASAALYQGCNTWMKRGGEISAAEKNKQESVATISPTVTTPKERAAVELDRQVVSSIHFPKGREGVSEDAATVINRTIEDAKARGPIDFVEVATWSDTEYPAQKEKLNRQHVQLATNRAHNVESYIHRVDPNLNIRVYNMAKHPSMLAEIFNTNEAELKNKLVALGVAPTTDTNVIVGRASTALIFVRTKK